MIVFIMLKHSMRPTIYTTLPTRVKNIYRHAFHAGSKSTEIGKRIHRMFERILGGHDFHVALQLARKGSKDYLAQEELLHSTYGVDFDLCSKGDYDKMNLRYAQALSIRRQLEHAVEVLIEMSFFAGAEMLKDTHLDGHAAKARPDLLVKGVSGQYQICDWKTTSKTTLFDIVGQIYSYDYIYSMYHYYTTLKALGMDISSEVRLFMLPDAADAPAIPIVIDLESYKIKEHLKVYMQKALGAREEEYKQFMSGNELRLNDRREISLNHGHKADIKDIELIELEDLC